MSENGKGPAGAASVPTGWGAVFSINLTRFPASPGSGAASTPTVDAGPAGFRVGMAPSAVSARRALRQALPSTLLTLGDAPDGMETMRPTAVATNVRTTPAGARILDVFVATGAETPPAGPVSSLRPPPVAEEDAWSMALSSRNLFQDLIVREFNARSRHLLLEAMAPQASSDGAWFARSVHRVLFTGSMRWGDVLPTTRQHAQVGFDLHGSAEGRLAVATYRSNGANIAPRIAVNQSFGLECDGPVGGQRLRLEGMEPAIGGGDDGILERSLAPIARTILGEEFRNDLEAIPFSACTELVNGSLHGVDGCRPFIRRSGITGDLMLAGDIVPVP